MCIRHAIYQYSKTEDILNYGFQIQIIRDPNDEVAMGCVQDWPVVWLKNIDTVSSL